VGARISVAAILAESARRYPDKTAIIFNESRLTYAQTWAVARQYAAVLQSRGVKPGTRVALLMPNIPHFAFAYYGILAAGGVVVPVHALLKGPEIAYAITDSGAELLICAGPLMEEGSAGAVAAGVPMLTVLGPQNDHALDLVAASTAPIEMHVPRNPQDEAVILYTSGTTGKPKGAVLTHDNILWNVTGSAWEIARIEPDDVSIAVLPLFHSFGQTVVLNASFRAGAAIVLMPRFEPNECLDLLVKEGVTIFAAVPTMFIGLLAAAANNPSRPNLRRVVSGGAALPVAVINQFKQVFDVDIYEGYGLSETSPVATFNQDFYGRKVGSIGSPIWGVDVAIANAEVEGRIEFLPQGQPGEIVIRGHNIFNGYLNKPEATAEVLIDGWFRSGDIGYVDEDGFFFIVDRKKDLIIRGGFNVYPREVEEVLMGHDAVAQVAVIGLPDLTYGEEICAVIVPVAGMEVDPEAVIAWTQERVGKHKYPRRVIVTEALPLGPSGKVLKRVLIEQYG
jgi:long-chain acyl-CoA synthetase